MARLRAVRLRRDCGLADRFTLLLIGSYEPLAPLYVGLTPQHSIVVTVCFCEAPGHRATGTAHE